MLVFAGYSIISGLLLNTVIVKFSTEDSQLLSEESFKFKLINILLFLLGSSLIITIKYLMI